MKPANIFADLPQIETDRLLLRKVTATDVDGVYGYACDPAVAEHTLWEPHASPKDSQAIISLWIARYRAGEIAPWGIILKETEQLIGTGGFDSCEPMHHRAEIGYALARQHWNRGYTTEAVRAMLHIGFTAMDLNRIQAVCNVENGASARVMEKAGMSYEGTLRAYKLKKGRYHDMKLYAILQHDPGDK